MIQKVVSADVVRTVVLTGKVAGVFTLPRGGYSTPLKREDIDGLDENELIGFRYISNAMQRGQERKWLTAIFT